MRDPNDPNGDRHRLHCYVPGAVAGDITQAAVSDGMPVSAWLRTAALERLNRRGWSSAEAAASVALEHKARLEECELVIGQLKRVVEAVDEERALHELDAAVLLLSERLEGLEGAAFEAGWEKYGYFPPPQLQTRKK